MGGTDQADERGRAAGALGRQADVLVAAAEALAERFRSGATLFAAGTGAATSDAEHVAVEFLHPVTVGNPALPAVPVALGAGAGGHPAGALPALARPGDALVVVGDGDDAAEALRWARGAGLLTVAVTAGAGGAAAGGTADHHVQVGTSDPWLAKELYVTAYHLLWELTHLFLGGGAGDPGTAGDLGATAALYPFLAGAAGPSKAADGVRSTEEKVALVGDMRRRALAEEGARLEACAAALATGLAAGGRVLTCGNGGSSTDAASMAQAFAAPAPTPLRAWSLAADRATVTALANDVGFDVVFARQLQALARPGDALVGISTSGSSANVLAAFAEARRRGVTTVGFAGYDGGDMAASGLVDHLFVVPSTSIHRVQEVQATLYLTLRALTGRLVARRPDGPAPPPPPPGPG